MFIRMSVEQIKAAIEQLSFEQRAELEAWLHGWKDDEWDEQMRRDVADGKLDDVLREVEDDAQALGRQKFRAWMRDPFHPSMQFKPLTGNIWSVRIGDHHRALARRDVISSRGP